MGRLTLDREPLFHDLLELYRLNRGVKPLQRATAVLHATRCRSFGMIDEAGQLVAAILLYQTDELEADRSIVDLALIVRPGVNLKSAIVSGVGLARLIMGEALHDGMVTLRALVRLDHPPGHRLAALVGFVPVDEAAGVMIYQRGPHG